MAEQSFHLYERVLLTKPPAYDFGSSREKKKVQRAAAVFSHGSGACVHARRNKKPWLTPGCRPLCLKTKTTKLCLAPVVPRTGNNRQHNPLELLLQREDPPRSSDLTLNSSR